ncbi:MAG TPA: WhiB family transcriptional regulator [Acidobacteriaceae bacterium]|nr:WhiB family transcriptional regulator [Acidobacteriaceae bacterium]
MIGTRVTGRWPVMTSAQTAQARCLDEKELMFAGAEEMAQAQQVCQDCPIRPGCLAEALDGRYDYGVWGGLDPGQRRELRRRHPEVTDWHALLIEPRNLLLVGLDQ